VGEGAPLPCSIIKPGKDDMKISVNKTVGSSAIHINVSEEKILEASVIAEKLFALLPEPTLSSNSDGVSVFAGLPMPLFRPGDESDTQ
jgi:hypothetical protein